MVSLEKISKHNFPLAIFIRIIKIVYEQSIKTIRIHKIHDKISNTETFVSGNLSLLNLVLKEQ